MLRLVSAQAGITLFCGKFHTIDSVLSADLEKTARTTVRDVLGQQKAQAAIDEEGRRLSREVDDIGEERWCSDQRAILNTDGVRVFLD